MRGFTLLETLMAVALLSLIAVAVATWTRLVADAEATVRPRLALATTMAATTRQIEDDLRCGDLASMGEPASRRTRRGERAPRVQVDATGQLVVETRDGGPLVRIYAFDAETRSLSVSETRGGRAVSRPLVNDLDSWEATFDPDTNELRIAWAGPEQAGSRRWVVR